MKKKLLILGVISLLLTSVFTIHSSTIQAQKTDITWECTLYCNESSGKTDYVVFGEAPDAHDGPPPDDHDVVKPPTPMAPYIRAYLKDNLPAPYNTLWMDYRQYPDASKVWNVSVTWVPDDYISPTDVTMTWNPTLLHTSEYSSINLCTNSGSFLKNMFIDNSYTFSCPANTPQNFKIICQRTNTPPSTPSIPSGETNGYHGTSYPYTTTATDPDGDSLYTQFDWGDGTTSSWLGPSASGSLISASHAWITPGSSQIKTRAKDLYGSESDWSTALSVTMMNRAPLPPSLPSPSNGVTQVHRDITLQWAGSDPDGDMVTYDVYFGTTTTPARVVSQQSSTSFSPGVLANQTTYYWRIVAWDPYSANTTGSLWSFTTETSVLPPPGGSGGSPTPENTPPVANASLSEHSGLLGAALLFDGSRSHDIDGYLTAWRWDFGDGTTGSGEKTTHLYQHIGDYTVTLTVTDDKGATGEDTITVHITTANQPPTQPETTGTSRGTKNTEYLFSFHSIDSDNDFVQYQITWGDDTQNTSDFLPNGTTYSIEHAWNTPGKYWITVVASDNLTLSEPAQFIVFIDVHFVGALGYLIDLDNDSIYDVFYRNDTGTPVEVQHLTNGSYLLDTDGDGKWNYLYDPVTGSLTIVTSAEATGENLWVFATIIAIAIIIIGVIVYFYKKKYF
jgi:chitodextrinase